MMKNLLFLALLSFISCSKTQPADISRGDEHSFSKPQKAVVKHLDLDIKVDFGNRTISGVANWDIENLSHGNEIVFDENMLAISQVLADGKETKFSLGDEVEFHGRPLKIAITADTKRVSIYYKTSKDAIALQWLAPEQTNDKIAPFLFSQGESIWSRTWIPCQDSPSVRFTYNAKVTVPSNLLALMSANNPQQKNDSGVYHFSQPKAIPSYLMAIAVGKLSFKQIDSRTGVYAEPSLTEKAGWEFAELGKMVNAAEKLFGPYRWGRYDVLVLPPSFPYGGMENPNLTFLTPGVLAGDRSLTGLLAHELGHSWSGNLVTNASWDDVWLNEGFTTYVEHRIGQAVFGDAEAKMQDVMSRRILSNNMEDYGVDNPETKLKVSTKGRNPDDSLSDIPYEKGYAFLQVVENAVGRERFDKFLTDYFNAHAFQSISTETFIEYFNKHLINGDKALADKIKAEKWIYEADIPKNITAVASPDFERIDSIQNMWRQKGPAGLSSYIKSTNEKQHFIDNLPTDITVAQMEALDKEFNFTKGGNFVIRRQWFIHVIRHSYKPAFPAVEDFLIHSSRTGSLQTLYKEMVKTPDGKVWAKKVFSTAKSGYHATTVLSVEGILK